MLLCHLLLVCGALSLAWYLAEKLRRYSVRGVLRKGLCSALFVALAICAWSASAGERGATRFSAPRESWAMAARGAELFRLRRCFPFQGEP